MLVCFLVIRPKWRILSCAVILFFFNDTATTEIYTLSLHDALPISTPCTSPTSRRPAASCWARTRDRKSTRLNSSHMSISYAVFCLKKKTQSPHPPKSRHGPSRRYTQPRHPPPP